MIKLGPNMPTMRYKNHPHPLAEPQRIPVRENNEYWADVWSIPHWKPNLLQHLELSHRMQFFEVMMDTRGSLFPWAHHLLICKDDLKSSLQLIKAFVLFHLGSGGCLWVGLSASIYGPWCLRSWKCCALFWQLCSRSQGLRLINACCGRECVAAEGGEMPPVLSETQRCHLVKRRLDVWLAA